MVVTFTKHNANLSSSSRGVFDYLNKENDERIDEFWENALRNEEDIESIDESKILIEKNLFFSQNVEDGVEEIVDEKIASSIIDENISFNSKSGQSHFFMLNISPSKSEMEHLKEVARLECEKVGLGKKEVDILIQSDHGKVEFDKIMNDLMHQQLREYARDVMKEYAANFEREVYSNPEKLPTQREERNIVKKAKENLSQLGYSEKDSDFYVRLKEEKIKVAFQIGKDLSTRKLNENDLVWFGKVEEKRSYKANDKWVMQNKKLLKEIGVLDPVKDVDKKLQLEAQLNRDRTTGQIVREGMLKGGDNYHVHVVVSRYDKCPVKSKKVSLSPLANQRQARIGKDVSVGFNRDNFRNRVEKSFDQKFRFQRQNTYNNYKNRKLYLRQKISSQVQTHSKSILNGAVKPIKNELMNQTGYNEIRRLSVQGTISRELGFRIPLQVPKTPLDAAIKIVRFSISKILDSSRGY